MRAALLLLICLSAAAPQSLPPSAVRPRPVVPSVAAIAKADPHSPENAARTALIDSLDRLAATQTAARRAELARVQTLAQARARQTKVRTNMLRLIGPLPTRTPLNPHILGTTSLSGLRIQKLLFDSQPNFHVTALLYLPDSPSAQKLPAIVMAPGHSPAGKAGDAPIALAFARAGFAVLSYDPIGQGERLQYPDPANPGKTLAHQPTGEHAEASLQPILLGESLAKYMLWDGMRAVDYLQSRPEIDPARIGAFGCSGGGAMTALLGALDARIAATGTACYITSFDTLLPSLGPQDGEQSTPGWIAAGLDFPDWIELAAPRPYAIIATTGDMFPFAGAQSTEAEARRFYDLFAIPAASSSTKASLSNHLLSSRSAAEGSAFASGPASPLAFITGPGGHGNLKPILPQILQFFTDHLQPTPPAVQGTDPAPKEALQVTPTGQVSTSYRGSDTVFSLNLAHTKSVSTPHPKTLIELQQTLRTVLGISEIAGPSPFPEPEVALLTPDTFTPSPPHGPGARFPAVLLLTNEPMTQPTEVHAYSAMQNRFMDIPEHGGVSLLMPSRPSPYGTEESKAAILGSYYLLGLRAELVGRTLLGLRVEDALQAIDILASRPDVDPNNITAEASGHEALVLLHAAVLDPRLKHITLTNLPPTYAQVIADPLPKDLPEDLLPGVLLHYDIPDLVRALGARLLLKQEDNQILALSL